MIFLKWIRWYFEKIDEKRISSKIAFDDELKYKHHLRIEKTNFSISNYRNNLIILLKDLNIEINIFFLDPLCDIQLISIDWILICECS